MPYRQQILNDLIVQARQLRSRHGLFAFNPETSCLAPLIGMLKLDIKYRKRSELHKADIEKVISKIRADHADRAAKYKSLLDAFPTLWERERPIDVFLVGHGFLAEPARPFFDVPPDYYVQFYVDEEVMASDQWEKDLIDKKYEKDHDFEPKDAAAFHPEHEKNLLLPGSQQHRDHILTFPGNVWGSRSLRQMMRMTREPDGSVLINEPLVDGTVLYFGSTKNQLGGLYHPPPMPVRAHDLEAYQEQQAVVIKGLLGPINYCYLSDILRAMTQSPGAPRRVTVHWLACRSPFVNFDQIHEKGSEAYKGVKPAQH